MMLFAYYRRYSAEIILLSVPIIKQNRQKEKAMDFYSKALDIKDEIVAHRRIIHKNAESGNFVPKTVEYIAQTLKSYGIHWRMCAGGVTATVGSGNPVILLRADMDALPMKEQSGESFASVTNSAHTCGHDMHAAMLLGAAKLLKQQEKHLCGTVKFMFQPGEETLSGCRDMLKNGLLQNPKPQAALALHTAAGSMPPGTFIFNDSGAMMLSADNFTVNIKGKGGHGAYPHLACNPITTAAQLYMALQSIADSEVPPDKTCIVSVCQLCAGDSGNIIPDSAVIKGAVRTDDERVCQHIKQRMEQLVHSISGGYNTVATVQWTEGAPALKCDRDVTAAMVGYIGEMEIPHKKFADGMQASASDDFAFIAQKIPSAYIWLSAGFDSDKGKYTAHNPKVCFNEDALPIGAAVYAHCAARWMTENFGR